MGSNVTASTADLAEAFQSAAIGEASWDAALNRLAAATGAHSGQLIGFGANFFNWQTNVDPDDHQVFAAINGHDPSVNSRVRIGVRAPELAVLDEAAFDTENDMQLRPEYGEYLRRRDMHNICLTNLIKEPAVHIGLSVMRSARVGALSSSERRIFEAAAPHVRAAVRTHLALEGRAIELTAAALERSGAAAFLLNRRGLVCAITPIAEVLVRNGDLTLGAGRLGLRRPADPSLRLAVEAAIQVADIGDRAPRQVVTEDSTGLRYVLEISPLPSRGGTPMEVAALVVARPPRESDAAAARAAALIYDLTPAEGAVAGLLANGLSAPDIAARQQVSLFTVRNQIQSVLQKSGMPRQAALIADLLRRG